MTRFRIYLLAGLLLSPVYFGNTAIAGEVINAIDGTAMDGFDVVAYFRENRPRKGADEHVVEYRGADWKFRSAENARDFRNNPEAFAPQFNGLCAYAVSEGYAAEVDFIDGWSVIDGKLYLNWNASVRGSFIAEQDQRKPAAARNWPKVRAGLADGSLDVSRHKRIFGTGIKHPQELSD